jgi:hypothetical protein
MRRHGVTRTGLGTALVLVLTMLPHAGKAETGPSSEEARPEFAVPENLEAPSFNNLGGIGLLATRTARFMPDGEVAIGGSYSDPLANYFMTWQATPWLETTFRYSEARGEPGDLDRALDFKIRLFRESDFFPAVAVGFQDILGNGPYSGEYIVFSSRRGALDISFGFSWGYPGSRGGVDNPFEIFSGSFKRRNDNTDQTGVPAFKNLFSGERMGVFGGIEYMTPLRGLTVKVEYNGADARTLDLMDPIDDDFPVNAGLNYKPFAWMDLSAGFVRGNSLSFGLSLRTNLHDVPEVGKTRDPRALPRAAVIQNAVPVKPSGAALDEGLRRGGKVPVVIMPRTTDVSDKGALTVGVTRALFDAGFERPLVELSGDEARITLSLSPEAARAESLKAAYVALSNLPARYSSVRLGNRIGDEVGREGQIYTRNTVETFARVDAAFDDLVTAGGVSSIEASAGQVVVEMTPHAAGRINQSALSAAADLMPDVSVLEVRTPDGMVETVDAAPSHAIRQREHLSRYLRDEGFDLKSLSQTAAGHHVEAEARVRFSEADVDRLADGAWIILRGGDSEKVRVTIARGGVTVAEAVRPSSVPVQTADDTEDGDTEAEAVPEGMRYLPLFGLVKWEGEASSRGRDVGTAGPSALPSVTRPSIRTLTTTEAGRLKDALEKQGLRPTGWRIEGNVADVSVANDRFRNPAKVIGRALRALAATVPGDVDWLRVTAEAQGPPLSSVRVLRRDIVQALDYAGSPEEIWLNTAIEPGETVSGDQGWVRYDGVYPDFSWAIYPELKQHFGNGSDGGYKAEGYLTIAGDVEIWSGFRLSGAFSRDIAGNLDKVPPGPGLTTPRVRSDIARYVDEGENAITRAIASYVLHPATDLYVEARAGLLEPMFAGAGIEALYRPHDTSYAIGVDINRVKQRDFDQLLDFRDYSTWTGHLSLYREWPLLGLEGIVRIGRYLAGDWGGTIDVYRRFDNGIRVGAWASLTDMPRNEFGQDSFAKGIYLSIPLDLFLPWSMRRDVTIEGRALNRDGGQRLERAGGLYEMTRPGTTRALHADWPNLLQ